MMQTNKLAMKCLYLLLFITTMPGYQSCRAQTNDKMENKNNPLMCDPEKGFCEMPAHSGDTNHAAITESEKTLKIICFTDPICSSCWGIEPQLRKLKLEYGNNIEIEYRMGGLLPDWSYNSGGISKPSDVAHHWDEVSVYYDMPIDGDVWLEDPLHSSYPPSIAFKAAELQDTKKAQLFLRELREMVFLKKKNIAKWEMIAVAAEEAGLDVEQLKTDFNGKGKELFEADLKLGRELGVRGFPTLFFTDSLNHRETVYGAQPYEVYEKAIKKLAPTVVKHAYEKTPEALFAKYHSLTAKEFSVLSGMPRNECETYLQKLVDKGMLGVLSTKNGKLWTLKGKH